MLAFGHTFCPRSNDDNADDASFPVGCNFQPGGDINGAGLRPLPSQTHCCSMLAAWDSRRHAVQKSSIASTLEECSWIGSGQTDERFTRVVAHKEHEHHQHHRHAFGWKVVQIAEIVTIVSSAVFGTASEHHQHHRCLSAGPTTRKVMLRMLPLFSICHPECETDDADDACGFCSKSEGKQC